MPHRFGCHPSITAPAPAPAAAEIFLAGFRLDLHRSWLRGELVRSCTPATAAVDGHGCRRPSTTTTPLLPYSQKFNSRPCAVVTRQFFSLSGALCDTSTYNMLLLAAVGKPRCIRLRTGNTDPGTWYGTRVCMIVIRIRRAPHPVLTAPYCAHNSKLRSNIKISVCEYCCYIRGMTVTVCGIIAVLARTAVRKIGSGEWGMGRSVEASGTTIRNAAEFIAKTRTAAPDRSSSGTNISRLCYKYLVRYTSTQQWSAQDCKVYISTYGVVVKCRWRWRCSTWSCVWCTSSL